MCIWKACKLSCDVMHLFCWIKTETISYVVAMSIGEIYRQDKQRKTNCSWNTRGFQFFKSLFGRFPSHPFHFFSCPTFQCLWSWNWKQKWRHIVERASNGGCFWLNRGIKPRNLVWCTQSVIQFIFTFEDDSLSLSPSFRAM